MSSDDEYVNKENATPTMSIAKHAETRIRVGGVVFLLDVDTIQKLDSEYLNQRLASKNVDGGSNPAETQGGLRKTASQEEANDTVVVVEADAECFSSLVHMARFGTLPTSIFRREKRDLLLQQAEKVWGIRPKVEEALEKARNDFRQACNCADVIQGCLTMSPLASSTGMPGLASTPTTPPLPVSFRPPSMAASVPPQQSQLNLSGPHHNFRRDDGSRRVFCSSCGHRDIDWRYHVGDFYSNCQTCHREILYKPDLGWCHKCRQCVGCQTDQCPGVPIKQLNDQVIPFVVASLKSNESALQFF